MRFNIGSNTRSYNITVNGVAFNSDFLFHPFITYTLDADFTFSPSCYSPGNPITFTNNSSQINYNRFYNLKQFNNIVPLGYTWNFGNGTKTSAINTTNTYSNTGTYNVSLTDTISGYYAELH
jgi:PKD repeat protein